MFRSKKCPALILCEEKHPHPQARCVWMTGELLRVFASILCRTGA